MSDNEDDYISQVERHSMVRFKRERTSEEMAQDFALYGPSARQTFLANLKTPASMSLLEASRRHAKESALRNTDSRLRKAGR